MIQDNEVFVIDDFIEKEYQEQIKKVLLGSEPFDDQEFPWYFLYKKKIGVWHKYKKNQKDNNKFSKFSN